MARQLKDENCKKTMTNIKLPSSAGIITEILRNILVIRFVRPQIRNPLSIDVLEDLHRIFDFTNTNADIEKIIFTGDNSVFASGANLAEIAAVNAAGAREFALRGQNLMSKIAAAPTLTIAAINGFCFGGALDLALACDKRIAAPNAVFCHPGVQLGIITGWGGTQRLPRLIGEAQALEMLLTAKKVNAAEALKIKLIDEIVENPLAEALKIRAKSRAV